MVVLIILVLVLAFIAIGATLMEQRSERKKQTNEDEHAEEDKAKPMEECCGAHEICETDLLRKMSQEIIYFDDEELDKYKNYEADDYNDEQIDEFREVLYSLKPNEIEDWVRSLDLREIEMPSIIKSELVFMMVNK